ncbi:NAD(P)H-dependent flavin oxidoreductase [Brevibacterium album]|uniref:NAD(P)H-dependent flavin oxidoreductase n=1 Tax=Brevibacterium album TaxID=417948 RepID=UPI00040CCBAD|nr:nitronate monooxygenase [Brevibacterium album]
MPHIAGIDFEAPIVLAPMAGGPSTPELCAAVCEAGGLGFLAAGYLSPEQLSADIARTAELTDRPFGVNVFAAAPSPDTPETRAQWREYRARLLAAGHPAEFLPDEPLATDDAYAQKLDPLASSPVAAVSFTFGHPSAADIERLHEAGKAVILYATSKAGIRAVAESGADAIGVQGIHAGGHRATVDGVDDPDPEGDEQAPDAQQLIRLAKALTQLPIIAGGGIASAEDVRALLDAGATAVQVGTRFLTASEAGTRKTHRAALLELRDRETVLTAAFSGRPARTVRNAFASAHSTSAPRLYPQLHFLTAGLRKEANAAGDAENLNLWAGTGFAACTEAPAAAILAELAAR